ncbi:ABC transporter substrate-binding protein [Bordetella genomosp. 10]|uniref:ABC transporter substrate-binding protein n=1 Tax=Bordetella genomosp. 10 TaxID=1416804 RepID=A0A261SM13_9BORD|nr:ABC transporter substrate-binding protein [Bordetella genomosp. 10]OZI38456.1 ABC transporter substrate-binding protein [Bordetella genomosp. 10]
MPPLFHHRVAAAAGLFTAALLAAAPAHADRLADIKARGTLICGTQNASSPYAYQDPVTRSYVGYDVDMCKAVAKGLGVKLEHKPLSTEARIPELKMGRVDVVAGSMAYLPERAKQVDYSLQYLQDDIRLLVKKKSGITKLADLAGRKVCTSKGSSSSAVAQRVLTKSQMLNFQDVSSCYLALQSEKVDALPGGDLGLIRFRMESEKQGDPTVMLDEPIFTEHMGLVVDKGNPELLAAIDKVIQDMDRSGELSAIYDKWMGANSPYKLVRTFKVEPVDLHRQ